MLLPAATGKQPVATHCNASVVPPSVLPQQIKQQ